LNNSRMATIISSAIASATLRNWIIQQHRAFSADLASGSLKNWVVCVGNEAGDLDTLASSIGFSFFASLASQSHASKEPRHKYIPVQQTKSTDFSLRTENMHVLKLANLLDNQRNDLPMPELICPDQVDFSKFTPYGAKYALVDHNRINTSIFGQSAEVVAVIDHHEPEADDTLYRTASPRLIQVPTGSCASLVVNYFSPDLSVNDPIPAELADLLLSAIVLDTANFKLLAEGGKATQADLTAKQWLTPRSRFAQVAASSSSSTGLKDYYKQLAAMQKDVSNLSSAQLLLRDYKQSEINGWSLGISSVPITLEAWIQEKCQGDWTKFLSALKEHADSKKLDLGCVLTHSSKAKDLTAGEDAPQPGRRLVLLATGTRMDQISKLVQQEQPNFKSEQSLQLSPFRIHDPASINVWSTQHQAAVYVFVVENPSATRKQVTPFLLKLMEKLGTKS